MRQFTKIVVASFGLWHDASIAGCADSFMRKVFNSLAYPNVLEESTSYVACKSHPSIKNTNIIAIARQQVSTDQFDASDLDYNLDVALADSSGRVSARYIGKLMNGGGPDLEGIELDTAKYFVSPNHRAFGIRSRYSMTEAFTSSESINLFLPQGMNVKRILKDLDVFIEFHTPSGVKMQRSREARRTLSMGSKSNSGFYDLVVVEKLTDNDYELNEDGEKEEKSAPTLFKEEIKTYRLQFNDAEYVAGPINIDFDCRIC